MLGSENQRRKRALLSWGALGALSSFGVAILAQFIEPGGWAIWPTLGLLLVMIICLVRISDLSRRL